MDPVSAFLLVIAAIFLVGIGGELFFARTGVPDVVWLVLVGLALGPVSGAVDRATLAGVAPYFGAFTLIVVLFDGGSALRLRELAGALPRATALACLGFFSSMVLVGLISMAAAGAGILPAEWSWGHAALLGAILGGSSSVVIMPSLRTAGLEPRISSLLNLESALTDVLCVVVTGACIRILTTGAADAGEAALLLGQSFAIGLGVGAAAGMLSLFLLRRLSRSSYAYPLVLATLLFLYVAIDGLGGSAALGILAAAVIVGNAPALSQRAGLAEAASLGAEVPGVHSNITFMVKSFFFTFIGAMIGPPWGLALLGVVLGGALLAARIPASLAATAGMSLPRPAVGIVAACLPRGMAAGVLAMMPAYAGVPGTADLPAMVFATVITTIAIFAVGLPLARRALARLEATPAPAPEEPPAIAGPVG